MALVITFSAVAERREIQIIKADVARNYRIGEQNINRLIGNVILLHNATLMNCDSAYLYPDQRFEAFGHVVIHKDTTWLYGDYMDYRSAEDVGKIRGKIVTLLDGKMRLRTQYIDFNTAENSAHFWDGGVIDNEDNLLESKEGTYYSDKKLAIFYQNVEMKNPDYRIKSDSLHYYSQQELAKFFKQTYMWSDDSMFMACQYGYYDRATAHVFLAKNAYAQTKEQEVWSDSAHYYRDVKIGHFYSNIQMVDTTQRAILFGDYAKVTDEPKTAMVTEHPSAALYGEKAEDDTMFVRADTFRIYSIPRSQMAVSAALDTLPMQDDTTEIEESEEIEMQEEVRSPCDPWQFPCVPDENVEYIPYDYAEHFAQHFATSAIAEYRTMEATIPYPLPLRANIALVRNAIELLADTVFARQALDTLAGSALFAQYVRQSPLADSLAQQIEHNTLIINDLSKKQIRDSLQVKSLLAQHTRDSLTINDLSAQRQRDSATVSDFLAQKERNAQLINELNTQRLQDSLRINDLLAQQTHNSMVINRLSSQHRRDSLRINVLNYRLAGGDTLVMFAADTLSAIRKYAQWYNLEFRTKACDSAQVSYSPIEFPVNQADSTLIDSVPQDSLVRHFLAYHNVRFFHRDMQGKCDSFIYIVSDSLGEMHYDPIIWNENNQITAERIDIRQKNNQIHQVELVEAAFVATADDSLRDFFNQIKGVNMLIHFANNNIYRMDVFSSGQTVYYMWDKNKISGVQKGAGDDIVIFLRNSKVYKIDYFTKTAADIIPPKDIKTEELRLRGFSWQSALRPQSRWEICQRYVIPSFRKESSKIPVPLFPIYDRIIVIEKSSVPYQYPQEAGILMLK
ncbi:hypothetical protein FACS189452_09260 [Bacteroidia bacterium]|nr:hypothetical protein FACS189452_09260 [Bacteroidia bacterium]